ncbi:SusC/RagA family TonB-linked outer membrane protein [Zunongwangia profunda]|uniref:SusC/RagA family TonB-linked outer membrane protein n=3 Tax=Zunongwangia profunda TaxID=398743 RepID=UPI0032B1AC5F
MLLLFFTLNASYSFAQGSITVTGTVTDNNSLPLPAVSVMEKGTQNGTQTDFDGKYTITVNSGATLIFTYVGMNPLEMSVDGKTVIDVAMENDPQALDEVVLVGYGKQKKISVVGAQSTIEPEELQLPVANLSSMLAGRVAGLTGVQRSGLPGYDGADIWIRGLSNISGGNSPLILVDGVQRSLSNIDPRDIASFTVLKDASATAVYGIRGANGVILIETKRGEIGKPEISVDYYEGVTQFTQVPDLADGVTYMELANEALVTRGQPARYSQQTIERTANNYDPLLYPNVDWIDEVFNDFGRNRRVSTNVSGGAEQAKYYVSLGYYDETGLFVTDGLENYDSNTKFQRYNFTSNLTVDITSTTEMHLGVQGYVSNGNYPNEPINGIFSQAMLVPPVEYPVMYPGGFIPGISPNGDLRNPYADVALRGYRSENKNQLYSNLRLTQDLDFLTEGLSLSGLFSFDVYNQQFTSRGKREPTYYVNQLYPYTEDGMLLINQTFEGDNNFLGYSNSNTGNRRFYLEASLNYDRSFGDHQITGLMLLNRTDYNDASATNLTDGLPFRNQGLAGRITYSYDQRYFVEANAGYNGSENFSPGNRYGFFPSLAAGWVISNEEFFEPLLETINYFKIRYSDGKVGSASGAGRFSYLSRVENGQAGYQFGENAGDGYGGISENYQGVEVTWAESRKQDLGIEINAFNNSFRLIFDLFKERTEGAFLQRSDVPNFIGLVSDPYGNLGTTENKGFDGTIEYNKIINDFSINLRGTFSYNKNTIIENGVPEQPYPWLDRRGAGLLSRWGYVAERLWTLDDDTNGDGEINQDDNGDIAEVTTGVVMPGDIKYKDLNGDGIIDSYDRKEIGKGDVPYLTYGLGISTQYKNFDLSLFFQGQQGADIMLSGIGIQPFSGDGGRGNLYSIATDRWTPENDDPYATYPRLSYGSSAVGQSNNTQGSTWWQRDQDFVRLKTAEFGYTLPKPVVERIGISNARFYLRATNLFTLTNFDLWDPELNTDNGNGQNGGQYPNISVASIGVNFRF